jgi:phosphoribosylformimino-5-aminoimidazole carboxamide ribotide isomerase
VPVQVGGGVRSDEQASELLDAGASRVIVGTRALEEEDWIAELSSRHPGEIVVACDVRERRVTTRGWVRTLPLDVIDAVETLNAYPLGGILVTAVHREGQLQGTDLPLMEDVAEASHFPVFAAGGVSSMQDLRALEHRGIAGVVIGMALYTGALDPVVVAGEFGQ